MRLALSRLSRPRALSSLGDGAIMSPAFPGRIDEREHSLNEPVHRHTECDECDGTDQSIDSDRVFVSEDKDCGAGRHNRAEYSDDERSPHRQASRGCRGSASRSISIYCCVGHFFRLSASYYSLPGFSTSFFMPYFARHRSLSRYSKE